MLKIEINYSSLDIYTYRKPANTELLLNFKAFCPQNWKSGLLSIAIMYLKKVYSLSK